MHFNLAYAVANSYRQPNFLAPWDNSFTSKRKQINYYTFYAMQNYG